MARLGAAALAGAALCAGSPQANDSSAELAAGGLRLAHNAHVRMDSEDLYISRQEVRVRYVFRNMSQQPQDILVAFPMPEIDAGELGDSDIGIASSDPVNFVDFSANVNGAPVETQVAERASLLGLDVGGTLRAAGLPLNPLAEGMAEKIAALPPAQKQALAQNGLALIDGDFVQPLWRYAVVYYWRQSFPPGREVTIGHRYRPVAGASVWYDELFSERAGEFCIDPAFARAARAKRARAGDNVPVIHWVSYVLTTGANWAGPIGRFRLTIDKGAPSNLVSLCRDGIAKTGPTTFEWQAQDYWPESDLKILFVE
ncbi:MAG TPA: DUF4424 domain-containing protein [Hyphomicrobiales bacterium]|nr:DUF4424 domain-containing protein [Rhodobiaceae bacterium]HXK53626.1 DUF4424 domain-containing protein [Hyphomicrobiales bacterium]